MNKLFLILFSLVTAGVLFSCNENLDKKLEGQYKMATFVAHTGETSVVDTLFFNFQQTVFRFQWFDRKGKLLRIPDGFYKITSDSLHIKLVYTGQNRDTIRIIDGSYPPKYNTTLHPIFLQSDTLRRIHVAIKSLNSRELIIEDDRGVYTFERY